MMIITLTLPVENGDILIQAGQTVDYTTPILKKHAKQAVKIPLAKMLKIPANKIFQHLKKFVGEEISKNDLIAEYKTLLSIRRYFSEYDGQIKEINHRDGYIVMETAAEKSDMLRAFFKAEVESIDKNVLKLKVKQYVASELREASDLFGGDVFYYRPEVSVSLTEDQISGKIIVGDFVPAYEQIKLETLGVIGFVTTHPLTEKTTKPQAKFKNIQDFGQSSTHKLPYCIVDKNNSIIYFYL